MIRKKIVVKRKRRNTVIALKLCSLMCRGNGIPFLLETYPKYIHICTNIQKHLSVFVFACESDLRQTVLGLVVFTLMARFIYSFFPSDSTSTSYF